MSALQFRSCRFLIQKKTHICIFSDVYFHLLEGARERERRRGKEIETFLSLAYSTTACNSPRWARSKTPGTPSRSPMGVAGTQSLSHHLLLPRTYWQEAAPQKQSCQNFHRHFDMGRGQPKWYLNLLATIPTFKAVLKKSASTICFNRIA